MRTLKAVALSVILWLPQQALAAVLDLCKSERTDVYDTVRYDLKPSLNQQLKDGLISRDQHYALTQIANKLSNNYYNAFRRDVQDRKLCKPLYQQASDKISAIEGGDEDVDPTPDLDAARSADLEVVQ